jgi:ASPIC/UnbV protein/VCBS repeat protein/Ig-like domain-containing protein
MKKMYPATATLAFLFLLKTLPAQISFTDQTVLLPNPASFFSGVSVGIADMNGDGLDDIVRFQQGEQLGIEYQAADNLPFAHTGVTAFNQKVWSVAVADVNNDGYCDILTGGSYDGVKVLTAQNNGARFEMAILPGPAIFVQGSNFADINNDGFLDAFACHDDGENRIWGNDGTGAFFMADEWIDMATTPPSDNSGNYGSVWTDFDNDGDPDLYIAKCRQGVDNPDDPRRINALFQNDGQNNYTEVAGEYGLKIKWQSWTADFQDIDNDGDLDCFVTNHDYNLQLLENDGTGHFTDISAAAGLSGTSGTFLQGIMRDFDNDGFVDLITAEPGLVFHNNGDKTFTEMTGLLGNNPGTLAAGDLNHDGFVDIYAAYQAVYNNPTNEPDKLWMNDANDNHFLAVNLEGTLSNRMGVGARIEVHGSWGIQIREVRAGESYGITNSLTQYFGLGDETVIDFVVVRWPSGMVDVVQNPEADQFITILENSTCQLGAVEISADGPPVLCPGESLTLTAPPGFTYLWNNGQTGPTITVTQAGNYSVVAVDSPGCAATSNILQVALNPGETPLLSASGETTFCQGDSVELISPEAASYAWNNGDTTQSITVTETGDYAVTIHGACGEFSSPPVHVEVLPAPPPVTEQAVTVYSTDPAVLVALGNDPHWYDSPTGTEPIAINDTLITPEITQETTFYVEDVYAYSEGTFAGGMPEVQFLNSPYSDDIYNGQLLFDVYIPLTLKQVTVTTDQPGGRIIELWNAAGDLVHSDSVDLPVGESVLDLNFFIEPGEGYQLTTNTANNEQVLGTVSPRFQRSNSGVQYPYTVPGVVSITGSDLGAAYYYYFFDWQIGLESKECVSERLAVVVTPEPNTVSEAALFGTLSVQPNPSPGVFRLQMQAIENGGATAVVSGLSGRIILTKEFYATGGVPQSLTIDLEGVNAGMYLLSVKSGERVGRMKLMVE